MRYQYQLIEQPLSIGGQAPCQTFGIRCVDPATGGVPAQVSDISCDRTFVCSLAARCTKEQLCPLHLLDVVLDAMP